MSSGFTEACLQLERAFSRKPDEVPVGFDTKGGWARRLGKCRVEVGRKIEELIDAGEWEFRAFRVRAGRYARSVIFYGPKKQ